MARKPTSDDLLTLEEMAQYLKVSPWTVYRFVKSGRMPCYRMGHQWRFRKSLVDEWLESTRTDRKRRARG